MAAHDAIIHNRTAQTIQVNKKRRLDPPLKKGKLTYLSMDKLNLPKGRAGKLKPLHIGPYEILEIFPETSNYVLKLPPQLEQRGITQDSKYPGSRLMSRMTKKSSQIGK